MGSIDVAEAFHFKMMSTVMQYRVHYQSSNRKWKETGPRLFWDPLHGLIRRKEETEETFWI